MNPMTLIALIDKSWGIAKNGEQICFIPNDMKLFKMLTLGGTVIMGRKTYEAIGHPLKERRNIVLSRDSKFLPDGVEVYRDVDSVLEAVNSDANVCVIGGESVYRQFLPYCDCASITQVDADLGADQFAPNLDIEDGWQLYSSLNWKKYKEIKYKYLVYGKD